MNTALDVYGLQFFDLGQLATLACGLEISAAKPGNVHPTADFPDMSYTDMCVGAVAIAPAIRAAPLHGVGQTVLGAVRATQDAVGKNTNLGTVLLLAPLACASPESPTAVDTVLSALTPKDAALVYDAIRLARPGGLGTAAEHDVFGAPPDSLLTAMQAAADCDMIARQYANGFQEISACVVPWLMNNLAGGWTLTDSIVYLQMQIMAEFPDSLIARKAGVAAAAQSRARAADVLRAGKPGDTLYVAALAEFDAWLRCDGNIRNPGTTADLIAAGLFVALRQQANTRQGSPARNKHPAPTQAGMPS